MGTNAKIHLELSHKTWPALGYSGATYGEWQRLACGWDDSSSSGPTPVPRCTWRSPAAASVAPAHRKAHGRLRRATSAGRWSELENVFPGTSAAYTGRAYEDHWALDPWVHGAYSYYRVGQATHTASWRARRGPLPVRRRAHLDRQHRLPRRGGGNRRTSRARCSAGSAADSSARVRCVCNSNIYEPHGCEQPARYVSVVHWLSTFQLLSVGYRGRCARCWRCSVPALRSLTRPPSSGCVPPPGPAT